MPDKEQQIRLKATKAGKKEKEKTVRKQQQENNKSHFGHARRQPPKEGLRKASLVKRRNARGGLYKN